MVYAPYPDMPPPGESRNSRKPLAEIRAFCGPNVVVFTRAVRPPIPGLQALEQEVADEEAGIEPGTKLALRGMSRKSSLNVAKLLSALDWRKLGACLHCTLTYHRTWPATRPDIDRAKNAISKAFSRNAEAAVWRMEMHVRKREGQHVPHWHVLAWLGGRDEVQFVEWLRSWWAEYSGNTAKQGCYVTYGDEARAGWYLAMHHAKRAQSPPIPVGRWWGVSNKEALQRAIDLPAIPGIRERERVWWARVYRRATGGRTRSASGFSWFLPRPWQTRVSMWVLDTIEREARERERLPF